ncbi:hypothetical protein [Massilia aerilata]|uniref:Uncharacterized protein n=1 Tax=Massilia aerilata TaxID=453817 RepID=A0ABW0RT48_9BURK
MEKIERLRAMAHDALREYQATISAGGEPVYPQWADDLLEVCQQAEAGQQLFYSPAPRAGRPCANLHN